MTSATYPADRGQKCTMQAVGQNLSLNRENISSPRSQWRHQGARLKVGQTDVALLGKKTWMVVFSMKKISSTIMTPLHDIVFATSETISYLSTGWKETQCPNYKYFGKPPSLFDPAVFDIQAAQNRLSEYLGAHRSGSK